MKKKHHEVIRVGDRVVVKADKFIIRVGYPIIWKDLFWEVAESEDLKKAGNILGVHLDDFRIIKEIAHKKAAIQRFGGSTRQIIYYPSPEDVQKVIDLQSDNGIVLMPSNNPPKEEDLSLAGPYISRYGLKVEAHSAVGDNFYVIKKRIAKTGKRFAPSYYGYGEDAEYEPGGLEDERTHVILELSNGFEIEQIHVEKMINDSY